MRQDTPDRPTEKEEYEHEDFSPVRRSIENGEVTNVRTVPNVSEHAGGREFTHDHTLGLQSNAIIVYGMGPKGLSNFQNTGVAVLRAIANTVNESVDAYKGDRLEELTEGCHHAHHH